MSLVIVDAAADVATPDKGRTSRCERGFRHCFRWYRGRSLVSWAVTDPLAHVRILLARRILSARKSMLLKVPLSVHDEMIRPGAVRRGRP